MPTVVADENKKTNPARLSLKPLPGIEFFRNELEQHLELIVGPSPSVPGSLSLHLTRHWNVTNMLNAHLSVRLFNFDC